MLEKMRALISEQLNVDPSEVVEDAAFEADLGADSLDLMELVMNLEDEYGISIATEELETLKTVGDVINYLKAQGIEE